MTTAHVLEAHIPKAGVRTCRGACRAVVECPEHHDRLAAVDTCADAVLELLELAVSWHELDWSEQLVVRPEHWLAFAAEHRWADPERAERVFSLAADVVGRHVAGPRPQRLAAVFELIPS